VNCRQNYTAEQVWKEVYFAELAKQARVGKLSRHIHAAVGLFILSSIIVSVAAQGFPISMTFATALPIPIGGTPTIVVTVQNISNDTIQLSFVGIRFEWSNPTSFFIGGNSEKGAVLTPGQTINYPIPVQIPLNVTPGVHRLSGYATYHVLSQGTLSGVQGGWWVEDLPFSNAQTPPPSQPQTTLAGVSTPQAQMLPLNSSTLEMLGVVVLVFAIGLFLERGRIKRVLARRPKPQETAPSAHSETQKAPIEKPAEEVKKEEEGRKEEEL
jgi:hypothetical protein